MSSNQGRAIPVILIMGRRGVGKGYFINTAVSKKVAHEEAEDQDCGQICNARPPKLHTLGNNLVHLVDTPGFDDFHRQDKEVLQVIFDWLCANKPSRMPHAKFGGILYLVDAGPHSSSTLNELKGAPTLTDHFVVVGTNGRAMNGAGEITFDGSPLSAKAAIDAVLGKGGEATLEDCVAGMETLLRVSNTAETPKAKLCGLCCKV